MAVDPVKGQNNVTAVANAHSEQSLVELLYVQEGNELLGTAMNSLESALNTTQKLSNILQALQNLHNQVQVSGKSAFNFNFQVGPSGIRTTDLNATTINAQATSRLTLHPGGSVVNTNVGVFIRNTIHVSADITDYERAYLSAASAYFGKTIDPTFLFANSTSKGFASYANSLKTLKNELRNEISVLFRQTPAGSRNDPASLLDTVRKVFDDLPSNFKFSAVQKWAIDGYNLHGASGAAKAGTIENDLTFAITAAQSLNDSQKEKVREFLFIFQEYYQSASAVLSQLTQIIEKMAQNISQ
jgi:hypothetical protein